MTDATQALFREETVSSAGAGCRLTGTLAIPSAAPIRGSVLILPGSGRLDRNGDNKRFHTGVYRDLAQLVNEEGFISLRYDKRGVGQSDGAPYETGLWELADDAVAAVKFLRSSGRTGPIILLGHSEGCVIAAAVNAREPVDGLVLLAGPCESLADTLARQQKLAVDDLRRLPGFSGDRRQLEVPDVCTRLKCNSGTDSASRETLPWPCSAARRRVYIEVKHEFPSQTRGDDPGLAHT